MRKLDKLLPVHKIDRKWVREEKRIFSEYPGLPHCNIIGEENWLELMQFYRDDVKWLLSLDHHKFWSQMIYSENVHDFLISFLKEFPPIFLRNNFLFPQEVKDLFSEVEHLVFLVFLRLGTEKESESCYIRNFGDVIYNNYLFTVPVILDICLIYGTSNLELVKKMINNIITAAPDFLDDFQEIIPQFVHVLNTVKEKVLMKHETNLEEKAKEILDLVLYLYDTTVTIQVFFELYPNVCQLFSKSELISKIIYFYSNVLPVISHFWTEGHIGKTSLVWNLIDNIRIDLLKIIKSIFDYVLNKTNEVVEKTDEIIYEYLELIKALILEPVFLCDYNLIYSLEYEIECALKNSQNIDSIKMNPILEEVVKIINEKKDGTGENVTFQYPDDNGVKLNSLITEVKDIFPHLEENFIKQCLNYYNNNSERVIAAILENHLPLDISQSSKSREMLGFRGKHKSKHENLNKMLNDKEEINRLKDTYVQLSFVVDEIYDDEYDDTYDENTEVSIREGDEMLRRPFVVPRVLRAQKHKDDDLDNNEEEEEEDEQDEVEELMKKKAEKEIIKRDCFVENPAISREWMEQTRSEQSSRDVIGSVKGKGQSKQVLRNREFKKSHKSFIANHNRKKLAAKKMY